jgi:hypothetical protein
LESDRIEETKYEDSESFKLDSSYTNEQYGAVFDISEPDSICDQ